MGRSLDGVAAVSTGAPANYEVVDEPVDGAYSGHRVVPISSKASIADLTDNT